MPRRLEAGDQLRRASRGDPKGYVTYTNFEAADAGSGVWAPGATINVDFGVDPSSTAIVSEYTFTVDSVTPLSPTSVAFSGTGVQDPHRSWHGPVDGTIKGSTIDFTLLEMNGVETYRSRRPARSTALVLSPSVPGTDNYEGTRTGTFGIAVSGTRCSRSPLR